MPFLSNASVCDLAAAEKPEAGRSLFGQLTRYGLVGLSSNALAFAAYLALTSLGVGVKVAMTITYASSIAYTFLFNKRWSFAHGGAHGPAFIRYCIAYAAGYAVNLAALHWMVDRLGWPHQWVQGSLILAISLMLFVLQRTWVFPSRPAQEP